MTDSAIEVSGLAVTYGGEDVLHRLSFAVRRGEVFGFLGPNGAGKSTTIKSILGFITPSEGRIQLDGLPSTDRRSRRKVGYMPEDATYYRFLTPTELLHFYGELAGVPRSERKIRIAWLFDLLGLTPWRKKPLSTLSKGLTQKVGLAQALIGDPDILILDEPTTGLDPLAKIQMREILNMLRSKGKTVFFSSHELSEAETVCDSVLILKAGRVLRSGSLSEILDSQGVRSLEKFYLQTMEAAR